MGIVIICYAYNRHPQSIYNYHHSDNALTSLEIKDKSPIGQFDPTIDKYGRRLNVPDPPKGNQDTQLVFDGLGLPVVANNTKSQILYRKGYVVSYNSDYRLPNWVMWKLTENHTDGIIKRPTNAWHEDSEVPCPRATLYDYRSSGWSRGHMCPAGDNKWDKNAMYDTFLLSNCCPQNANLNSGVWNEIEIACRRWAKRFNSIYIICGPIMLRTEHQKIGINKVTVPDAFFKVVLCTGEKPKGIGFVCRNTDGQRKKDKYINSIKQIERITGMSFFPNLRNDIAAIVKDNCNLNQWDY